MLTAKSNFPQLAHRWTRRAFLATAAGTAARLTLRPLPLCANPTLRELQFLVISDTHLGRKDDKGAERQWEKTTADLVKAPGDFVLHLGDVVDSGREDQYAIYKTIRDRIGKPVYEIPGNHDPASLFQKHLRETIDTVIDQHWLRLLLLNNSNPESHLGFLTDGQLDWIDRQCADAARQDRYVILAMHVPAHTNAHPDRGWYVKPADGQRRLYEILTSHKTRVLALFHGHFHNGLRGWDDHPPCHEVVFPSALYNQDRGLEKQQAPGYNLPEFRPGFTAVKISGGQMTLTYQPIAVAGELKKELTLAQIADNK